MASKDAVVGSAVGLHARPAATFVKAVAEKGVPVTIAKEGGDAVPAGSILSIMGLGIKQGDTVTAGTRIAHIATEEEAR